MIEAKQLKNVLSHKIKKGTKNWFELTQNIIYTKRKQTSQIYKAQKICPRGVRKFLFIFYFFEILFKISEIVQSVTILN